MKVSVNQSSIPVSNAIQIAISRSLHSGRSIERGVAEAQGGLCLSLRCLYVLLTVMFTANLSSAATLEVAVQDRSGKPLKNVVVTVSPERTPLSGHTNQAGNANHSFVMDQINLRFVPQILVVPVNANVNFPNSDTVSHQVYSFSKAKSFQLALYKGKPRTPILFDKPGLIVLGCNIHDDMIGYIYVTDAPWFGLTDNNGMLKVPEVDNGKVSIAIWSPVITDAAINLTHSLEVADEARHVSFKLKKALRNSPEPRPRNPEWDY